MGRRRIEATHGHQRVDRPRRLVQEHRADATVAHLVLARRAVHVEGALQPLVERPIAVPLLGVIGPILGNQPGGAE